ncbi:MAG: BRCT domain-containing protein [Planctomycetota bacterium]|jgi:hypothetical protein
MPAGKKQQSNAMLYTLIAFVGLFLAALTVAIIFYVKIEDFKTQTARAENELAEMAGSVNAQRAGTIVGARQRGENYLGKMVDYLDVTASLVVGELPEDTSAEVKADTAGRKVSEVLESLARTHPDVENIDPNSTGLVRVVEKLQIRLSNVKSITIATQQQLGELQKRFNEVTAASFEKEQKLLAEKEKYEQQVNDIKSDYNSLKALMEQTTEQQVKTLMDQLDQERVEHRNSQDLLRKAQAELMIAADKMKDIQAQFQAIVPSPDKEIASVKPDGKIILIDDRSGIVHLNLGSDDRVYRGLTFAVYDKNMPLPRDGKGKAEIEVFDVMKNISAARIMPSMDYEKALNELLGENIDAATIMLSLEKPAKERTRDFEEFAEGSVQRLRILNDFAAAYDERKNKRPIAPGDVIANLIWERDRKNVFVVAGDFDLNGDAFIDEDAVDKIRTLIRKWGGRVTDTVSTETDFLILGRPPRVLPKPTFEILEVDPMAMEKYEASLQRLADYKLIQNRAGVLHIPLFNAERFLYFIGYKVQSTKAGAF